MTDGRDLITISRLRADQTCSRLHWFKYVQGFRPVHLSEPLRFGIAAHDAIERWWMGEDIVKITDSIEGKDEYLVAKLKATIINYPLLWPDRDAWEVVGVEVPFKTPLINPSTMNKSRTYMLAGKIDLILRNKKTGDIFPVEHKTTVIDFSTEDQDYWTKLQMDHQITAYWMGCQALGHDVRGMIYDVLKRPAQRPLKATPKDKRIYRKKDGGLYKGQREIDESVLGHFERIAEWINDNPGKARARKVIPRVEGQLKEGLQDIWDHSKRILLAEKDGLWPRNPNACHQFHTCSFWDCCAYGVQPAHDSRFEQLNFVHPELEELSC